MPNIVYALTNPAMPGIVKIGMTDKNDVKERMRDLYTTGVPLPFECVIARQMRDWEAGDYRGRSSHRLWPKSYESIPRVL